MFDAHRYDSRKTTLTNDKGRIRCQAGSSKGSSYHQSITFASMADTELCRLFKEPLQSTVVMVRGLLL